MEVRWLRSGIFIINFEQISNFALMFLLMTFNTWTSAENRIPIMKKPLIFFVSNHSKLFFNIGILAKSLTNSKVILIGLITVN